MSVLLIDTSVFCNIVPVPGFDQDRDEVFELLNALIQKKATLLLPMAAVLETGNHIAQLPNGQVRRSTATKFCDQVMDAIDGTAPWTPTPFWDIEGLKLWLGEFPRAAMEKKASEICPSSKNGNTSALFTEPGECLSGARMVIWKDMIVSREPSFPSASNKPKLNHGASSPPVSRSAPSSASTVTSTASSTSRNSAKTMWKRSRKSSKWRRSPVAVAIRKPDRETCPALLLGRELLIVDCGFLK